MVFAARDEADAEQADAEQGERCRLRDSSDGGGGIAGDGGGEAPIVWPEVVPEAATRLTGGVTPVSVKPMARGRSSAEITSLVKEQSARL